MVELSEALHILVGWFKPSDDLVLEYLPLVITFQFHITKFCSHLVSVDHYKEVDCCALNVSKRELCAIALFSPLQLVSVEAILTSCQPKLDIFVAGIRKAVQRHSVAFGGFRN